MKKTTWPKIALLLWIALFFGMMGLSGPESFGEKASLEQQPNMFIQRFDKDGDGNVSREEFIEHFDDLDANGDGYIDVTEAPKGPQHSPGAMSRDFIKDFDKDEDGRVSREEFPGPDGFFDGLDTNGDGYVDAAEAPNRPHP